MLPEPALSFTIPSLHDGTILDCRIYHPASLCATNARAPPWKRHAAVVAHPYAPMGGCYDDPILESVATGLLRTGYLVGTFNFRYLLPWQAHQLRQDQTKQLTARRGAGHSAGRTSWTAKPERDDYASVVGFMVHYIHFLDPFSQVSAPDGSIEDTTHAADIPRSVPSSTSPTEIPALLMGGYSYGAMITAQIPPLNKLLEPFASPHVDSNAAQIRLRAQHLAEQQNVILGSTRSAVIQVRSPHSPTRRPCGVRVGGDEGDRSPRKSHESGGRRSFSLDAEDRFRKGVHEFMAKRRAKHPHLHLHSGHRRSASSEMVRNNAREQEDEKGGGTVEIEEEKLPVITGLLRPRPAYFMVSPLQGLVTHLATMSLLPSRMRHDSDDGSEGKLVLNPTLAVFGDNDVFVPVGRLRGWMAKLGGSAGSLFTGYEVATAGHFWVEEGVLHVMTERVGAFASGLICG